MTEELVDKLLETLHPALAINTTQLCISTRGNTPIQPEIVLVCGLRFLVGVKYTELADIFGHLVDSSKRIVNTFLNAVDSSLELKIKIPDSVEDLN